MHTEFAISGGKASFSIVIYLSKHWLNRHAGSKCWHQQLRRSITSPAKAIVTALGIPRGTLWNKYIDLHLAFFFSTLCHVAACYLIGRNEGGMFRLWIGQATIIMLEDYVVYLGKQCGIKENGMFALLSPLRHACIRITLANLFRVG
jgi:hypothetical protein